jgi:hypothetical protein
MPRLVVHLFLFLLLASFALAQKPPVSDPQALALAAQSIAALTSGNAVLDVTLSGNATWIVGSDKEAGSTTLLAKGTGESRVDLNLSGGTRSEVRNDSSGYPQGQFVGADGTVQSWALHNCWINASWFFPALSILAPISDPAVILTYVGEESRNGAPV